MLAGVFTPELTAVAAFVVASLALNLTPGLDMVYVVGTTLQWRTRAGVQAALGIALGSLCHALLAAAGLSALVAASPGAMNVLTFAGAAYLVRAGIRMMRDTSPLAPVPAPTGQPAGGRSVTTDVQARPTAARVVLRGALVNLLNVKVIVFYLTFLPQFVRPDDGPTWQQAAFFGLLFNLLGTSVLIGVALGAAWASRTILSSPRSVQAVRRVCGGTLVVIALALTVSRIAAG